MLIEELSEQRRRAIVLRGRAGRVPYAVALGLEQFRPTLRSRSAAPLRCTTPCQSGAEANQISDCERNAHRFQRRAPRALQPSACRPPCRLRERPLTAEVQLGLGGSGEVGQRRAPALAGRFHAGRERAPTCRRS